MTSLQQSQKAKMKPATHRENKRMISNESPLAFSTPKVRKKLFDTFIIHE